MAKKRKMKRKGKVVIALVCVGFIIVMGALLIQFFMMFSSVKDVNHSQNNVQEEIHIAKMIMVGDNLIHDSIYEEANRNAGYNGYDFKPMYRQIKEKVKGCDIIYYNQETILGGSELGVSSYPAFNSPYEVGDAMIDVGFNLVSLATNHTLDRGEKAVINSRSYWNGKANVLAVGSYSSKEEQEKVNIQTANGITYTMLNYTYGTNGIKRPTGKDYLVNIWPVTSTDVDADTDYQQYKEQVKKDIEMVRDKVDLLIVAMHWGTEYEKEPNLYQKDAARYLASLGVDIVIGTHPHVIQPIEYIDKTLVIYSLGNFASAHEVVNLANRVGLMTSLEIAKDDSGEIVMNHLENELLYMYYTPAYTDFQIIPFSELTEEYLEDYKAVYQEYKKVVTELDSGIKVIPIKE